METWKETFSKCKKLQKKHGLGYHDDLSVQNIRELKEFLDMVHIKEALVKSYFNTENYPYVETRALMPSFDLDVYEYKDLPGFTLIVLDRQLSAFHEVFQYDTLHNVSDLSVHAQGPCCPLEKNITQQNTLAMLARMPRFLHEEYRRRFHRVDITALDCYPDLLPYLLEMDRAHLISKSSYEHFQLSGVFASLPSDIDGEVKRCGLRMGKFAVGNNKLYERNRDFVMHYLMELYGFPIASERRTSAALFARRLNKMGEKFLIRVLGQSDRTITTIWNDGENKRYPYVEKIALVRVDKDQPENIEAIRNANAFVDPYKNIAILKVTYVQHAFDLANIRQDRALSVESQCLIHPLTGEQIEGINLIRDSGNLILRLNDIVRGEVNGTVLYKRTEVIENTDTEEKRLKFLYSWFSKHQRRVVGYSEEFFLGVSKILEDYFNKLPEIDDVPELKELIIENKNRYSFIKQARKVRILEDISQKKHKGVKLTYAQMLNLAVELVKELRFEFVHYFEDIVDDTLIVLEHILNDKYLRKNYIEKSDLMLTETGCLIKKKYGRLVILRDEIRAIKKSRLSLDSSNFF